MGKYDRNVMRSACRSTAGRNAMRSVCRSIAVRKLLEHKMQSLCMIAAVILTEVLFTTAFSSIVYFNRSIQQAEMENAAWTAHGAVLDVSDEQYDAMQKYAGISEISSYKHLGFLEEDIQDEVVEMQYSEEQMAVWMYYELLWGHMPQSENEIVVSSWLLENKGSDAESGSVISIRYMVNGISKEREFVVCGTYEQKPTSAEVAFISETFLEKELQETAGDENRDSMLGVRVAEVMFKNTAHLEQDMEQLLSAAGAGQNDWILNPAYAAGTKISSGVIMAVAGVLLLITGCGYFIICNIYNISVMQDTRFYGSLAMLGFLEYEIRMIVKIQTNILCAVAIPLGFLPGVCLSMAVLPRIMGSIGNLTVQHAPSLIIFVLAAIFSYVTVRISSRKPARMAAKMAPTAAKRYVCHSTRKGRASRHGHKMLAMAWKNMMRNRKKSIMICSSIILCIVLSSLFYTVSKGLDVEVFLQDAVSSDVIVGSAQYFNQVSGRQDLKSIDNSFVQTISRWDGMELCGGACVTWIDVPLDQKAYEKHQELAGEYDDFKDGTMHGAAVYGIDEYLFRKIDIREGSLDWDEFCTGNYVIASGFMQTGGTESCYEPGDKAQLAFDGSLAAYTVMAIGDIPYDLSVRSSYRDSVELYLPVREWKRQTQSEDYYMYAYDVRDDCEPQWEERLSALKQRGTDFSYVSKMTFRRQFEGFVQGIAVLGVSISLILGTIGLMNFINVIYSSIYERRRELAVMQSMGMMTGQVYGLLSAEGGCYMLISWLGGIAAGLPLGYLVMSALGKEMKFFRYEIHMLPYLVFGIAGGILAVCVPCLIFYAMDRKEDLLYRLRHD